LSPTRLNTKRRLKFIYTRSWHLPLLHNGLLLSDRAKGRTNAGWQRKRSYPIGEGRQLLLLLLLLLLLTLFVGVGENHSNPVVACAAAAATAN
jgi:hypothetical protein